MIELVAVFVVGAFVGGCIVFAWSQDGTIRIEAEPTEHGPFVR